jgi:predicted Zn-dependent protease
MRRHLSWVLAGMIVVAGCAKEQIVHPPVPVGVLTHVGLPSSQQTNAEGRLTDDPVLAGPVMRVSSRLVAAAGHSAYAPHVHGLCWTIAVYDYPTPGAFVGSDGLIVVYLGTFRLAETEAGLAALLSHEFAHAMVMDTARLTPPCLGTRDQPRPSLSTYADERDADTAGLYLMADAGYDPRELLRLWERMRMEQQALDKVVEHLTYERRMEQIAQRLPEAIRRYERTNRAPQKPLPSHKPR